MAPHQVLRWLRSLSLDWLLALFWSFGTLCVAAAVFLPRLRTLASHGKLSSESGLSRFRVPKSYFSHFYMLGFLFNAVCSLCSLIMSSDIAMWYGEGGTLARLAFQLQVGRRLYETLCVNNTAGGSMHVFAYVLGICYYVAASLTLSVPPSDAAELDISSSWSTACSRAVGAMLFVIGSVRQHRCHCILAELRAGQSVAPREGAVYKVPHGDWFELVTAPHYFAEILIYVALWVLRGTFVGSTSMPCLFAFVVANLSFTAYHSHHWYRNKFEDYPKQRRILVPFLF